MAIGSQDFHPQRACCRKVALKQEQKSASHRCLTEPFYLRTCVHVCRSCCREARLINEVVERGSVLFVSWVIHLCHRETPPTTANCLQRGGQGEWQVTDTAHSAGSWSISNCRPLIPLPACASLAHLRSLWSWRHFLFGKSGFFTSVDCRHPDQSFC